MKNAPRIVSHTYTLEGHAQNLLDIRLDMLRECRENLDGGRDSSFYKVKLLLKRLFPGANLAFYDEDAREFVIVTRTKTYRYV